MARYAGTVVEFPEIKQIRMRLEARFAPNIRAKFLGAALKKTTQPAVKAIRQYLRANHKRVSGNLSASVTAVVRRYPKTGNAVALAGFQKPPKGKKVPAEGKITKGKDKAYHAGLITFGTKERKTSKSVASSWNKRGPFTIKGKSRGGKKGGSNSVKTVPRSPKAFFKRAPAGKRVSLGRVKGTDPVGKAFKQIAPTIRRILQKEMSDVVERAARFLQKDFPPRNRS